MPNCNNILLIGAGGHCLSVLDSLIELSLYDNIGIVDRSTLGADTTRSMNSFIEKYMVGSDDDLPRLFAEGYRCAFITVGSIGNTSSRRRLYTLLKSIGFQIPNIIDRSSIISKNVSMGEGNYIGKHAVINTFSHIGNCTIINTSCVIEHECQIGDFVHIAPGCIISGNVHIGEDTHLGIGSMIKQGIHVGKSTMIGMGSVVLKDIGSKVTAYGNPCKEVKQ